MSLKAITVWMPALILLTQPASAQQLEGRFTLQTVRNGITILMPNEGSGNAIMLATEDGTIAVDTPADTIAESFIRAVATLDQPPIRWVVNTHWHRNHAGANHLLRDQAALIAPRTLRERSMVAQTLPFLTGETYPPLPKEGWPTVTFEDSLTLHIGGETVRIWHARGHTDTDAVVWLVEAGLVATGDLWTPRGTISPDIDTGGSVRGILGALDAILARVPEGVIIQPGHGPAGTKSDLRRYRDGIAAVLRHAAASRQQGLTAEEASTGQLPEDVVSFAGRGAPRMIRAAMLAP